MTVPPQIEIQQPPDVKWSAGRPGPQRVRPGRGRAKIAGSFAALSPLRAGTSRAPVDVAGAIYPVASFAEGWHFRSDVLGAFLWIHRGLCAMKFFSCVCLSLGVLLMAGCVRFQPQPLSADKTAAEFESRSLTNAELKLYLEKNLHKTLTTWPMASWDFETLTLVAFYYHPSLEVARADWRVQTAGEKTAGERPNPTLNPSAAYEPAAGAFSPWIPSIILDIPLETAGKRKRRIEQATHLSESARLNIATTAWQVRGGVRTNLLEFSAAQQRLELLKSVVVLREDVLERLESQHRAGAISAFDLNTVRLALIRARADVADAQRTLAEARPALADALGLPDSALDQIDFHFDLAAPAVTENLTSRQAREMALLSRTDIRGALADYAAAQSGLQLEIAKQYPDIHLSPGYMWNAGSTGEHDWQIGGSIELPVLNRHRGPIAEASARRDASAARFLALQAKVISEIDAAVASFRATGTNVATLEALAAAQAKQQQLVEAQFQAGAIDRLEVLNAQVELNAAQVAQFEAQVKLQQALGALENAVQRPFEIPQAVFESSQK
jgi:outer membrane protein TolC